MKPELEKRFINALRIEGGLSLSEAHLIKDVLEYRPGLLSQKTRRTLDAFLKLAEAKPITPEYRGRYGPERILVGSGSFPTTLISDLYRIKAHDDFRAG